MAVKFTAEDACRWVKNGTAPRWASSSRVTPMWRAMNEAVARGLVERAEGFSWKLTSKGEDAITEATHD